MRIETDPLFNSRGFRALPAWKTISFLFLAALLTAGTLTVPTTAAPALHGGRDGGQDFAADAPQTVTIQYVATGTPQSVCIAGSFNGWNRTATPLAAKPDGVTWRVTLSLEPGIYEYRLVINGNRWITPPDVPRRNDAQGNPNALLLVAPPGYADMPAQVGDGRITPNGLMHRPFGGFLQTLPPGVRYVVRKDRTHLTLTLRTRHDDVQQCRLVVDDPAAKSRNAPIPMLRLASDALFDYWQAETGIAPKQETLRYAFQIVDGSTTRLYDWKQELQPVRVAPAYFTLDLKNFPPFDAPDWARDAVFYQIFPDRFANGDPSNDPPDVQPWESKPTYNNRMGGDLAGITAHLDYLRDLGVNALYLNPIFASRSNHGYDTTDYLKIDPRFGTIETLKALTAKAHLRGWHVLLDGVFNHTGVDFAGFQSLQKEGERSPYRNWYFVHGFPIEVRDGQKNYDGWFGSPWMPKLNVANPPTRDFLLDVGTRWIKEAKIDGWRLDAADEVNHDFWKAFRKSVRSADPQAYLVGEIWGDARDWLGGDEFDSVMNYRWRGAALDFFAFEKTSPRQFDRALAQIRADYPAEAAGVMFNMLGSHDTERIRTLCRGEWARQKQAILFQMTYPGTPCIYYGDEIGMEGGRDPDDRRAMIWDEKRWDKTALDFYKQILAVRRRQAVLRRGDYQTVLADDATGTFAYLRTLGRERALIVFNRNTRPVQVTLSAAKVGSLPWSDWLNSGLKPEAQNGQWILHLPERGVALLGQSPAPARQRGL